MTRWLREDAIYDVLFLVGVAILVGGLWAITPLAAIVFVGFLLMTIAALLRVRR